MKFPKITNSKKQRRGVAAVEFAIVAPVLLFILFGMVEISRYLTAVHATTGAAREVVRLAAVGGADSITALSVAKRFMEDSNFRSNSVTVEIEQNDISGVRGLQTFNAVVSIKFSDVSVIGDPFDFGINDVQGHSAMLVPDD